MRELIEIQSKLKVPKSQWNKFGKYNYRNLEDICEALKPLLAGNRCCLTITDSIEEVAGRVYVKSTVKLMREDGTMVAENTAYARESETKKGMDDSQITGATSSYARKYALNGLFCIDDTKDADSSDNNGDAKAEEALLKAYQKSIESCKTIDELKQVWVQIPKQLQPELEAKKDMAKTVIIESKQ